MLAEAEDAGSVETMEQRAARWRVEEARRVAIVAGCTTWQERALRLQAAGELSDGMLVALGLLEPAPPRDKASREV